MTENRTPEWWDKIKDKAEELDDDIVAFFKDAGKKSEDVFDSVKGKVKGWLDRDGDGHYLEYDEGGEKEKAFRAAVQQRIDALMALGKIKKDDDNQAAG
ncbi:hypothetical protein IT575_14120 [bacterium]|nr:hypothetical protein [bacterium]